MELQRYLLTVRRWLWLVVLGTVLAAGMAFMVSRNMTPIYSASATLLINPASSNVGTTDYSSLLTSERLARTYSELLRTPEVLDVVIKQLSLQTTATLLARRVQVQLVRDTQLIRVSVEDTDPVMAATLVNTIAEVFKTMNEAQQLERFVSLKDSLNAQIQQVEKNVAATQAEIYALGTPLSTADEARLAELQTTLTLDSSNYTALQSNLAQARLAEAQAASNPPYASGQFASLEASLSAQIQQVEKQIATTQVEINALSTPRSPAEESRLSQLQTALTLYSNNYASLQGNLAQVQLAEKQAMNNVVVAQKAQAPTSPVRPRTLTNTMLAAVVGAMLALGIAFLIEYLDDTLKSPDDIEQVTRLSILGTIGVIEGDTPSQKLIATLRPRSPISEAYRVLRTNIHSSSVDEPVRSLMVTSSNPGEGKSVTVANLAVVLAQAGKRVIVVDSDLRWPTLHEYFSIPNHHGLTTALLDGQAPVERHLQPTGIKNLRVLTSGPLPPNPAELLGSRRMSQIIEELCKQADVIVLDTPPLLAVTDATLLSRQVDGTLVIVQPGVTRRGLLTSTLDALKLANARVLGTVVNHLDASHAGYYHYGYHYYYYDSENGRRKKHRRSLRLRWPWRRPPQSSSAGEAQVETLVGGEGQEQLVSPTLTASANAALMRGEMSQASTRSPSPTLKLETGKRMPEVRVVNDPPAVQEAELIFGGEGQAIYSRFEIRPFPSMPGKTGTINEKPALTATDLEMASETQRTGYTMLRALDRLGVAHSGNGSAAHAICFSQVTLYGHLAAYEVDSEWLAFSVDGLAKSDVLGQLSAAMRKPVKAFTQGGLTYVVELQSRPGARQAAKDSASFDFWANRVVW